MTSDTEAADVLAPRLAHGLWGTRGVRTYARVGGEYRDGRAVYRGVAGYTVVTGTGAVDAVATDEHATSDAAWSALVDELRAKGRAR